ncbi:ribosome modulation factor [Nocardia bovistercoris]|uniref:Uncharacterized protein n=1 Tax=Nocardia bovistercoris TaxID=2785916 RepID=A0A931IEB4_9NOCA|nr:hypothetical protein [Nocardia bovistercoris]MBH0778815.1 hypothetical protein [Nocardia bovistercoris]
MSARDIVRAYQEGLAAAADPAAVNPYVPAAPGSLRVLLARMWLRGRLKHALDVPDTE